MARQRLPLRVDLQQLLGQLAHLLGDLGARLLPGLAAELVELGLDALGAGVGLHLVEAPDRQVERAAVVLEVEEVDRHLLGPRAQRQLGQPLVDADAVQLVDDEVARHQVLEVGLDEGALGLLRRPPRRLLAEDLLLRDERRAVERQLEAVAERAEHDLDVHPLRALVEEVDGRLRTGAGAG